MSENGSANEALGLVDLGSARKGERSVVNRGEGRFCDGTPGNEALLAPGHSVRHGHISRVMMAALVGAPWGSPNTVEGGGGRAGWGGVGQGGRGVR